MVIPEFYSSQLLFRNQKFYTQVQLNETKEGYLGTSKNNYTDMTQSVAKGELVLQNLSQGSHKLEINGTGVGYTKIINSVDVNENLSSVSATFQVNLSAQTPASFQFDDLVNYTYAIVFLVVVAVVVLTILAFLLKKRHHKKVIIN
jgi:hypothetical protein